MNDPPLHLMIGYPVNWAVKDAVEALRRLENEARFTECGRATHDSLLYVSAIQRMIRLCEKLKL